MKILTMLAVLTAFAAPVWAAEAPAPGPVAKPQELCPVMGGKVDTNEFVDVKGRRIYVCCAGCIPAIQKDPDTYIAKLEAAGVTLPRVQTTCPIMGRPIDRKRFVDHGGKRLYFCCPSCVKIAGQDPAKYIAKAEAGGVILDPTPPEPKP